MTKEKHGIGYLGTEFLLWLYYKSCTDNTVSLNNLGIGEITISVEDTITLSSATGEDYTETIKAMSISGLDSVRNSIKIGRLPVESKVKITSGDLQWLFQIKAVPFKVTAVKLPFSGEKDEDTVISARLLSMTRLELIVKALFNTFLLERDTTDFINEFKEFLGV
ncbi:hypothetical protein J6Z39_04950 [bacterium]|nr:hypothetical protein [bacterium]